MKVLGIESSCDECSFSVVEDGNKILALEIHSQLKEHTQYGGVVPEIASRAHVVCISFVYEQLCKNLNVSMSEMKNYIDGIAVTVCPGLSGSLQVGLQFAKALSLAFEKPLIGIDHIQAHFYSGQLAETIEYPYIGLVVSGGHTLIAIVHGYDRIEIKGVTIDDACGEAFDKVARELGLGYPGGPAIDALARTEGDMRAANFPVYEYKKNGYNFSYSGLKTAVLWHREKYWDLTFPQTKANIVAAFQKAAIEMIVSRVRALVQEEKIDRVSVGGGVACNSYLRSELQGAKEDGGIVQLVLPLPRLCADNAAMIAGLGYQYLHREIYSELDIAVSAREHLYKS